MSDRASENPAPPAWPNDTVVSTQGRAGRPRLLILDPGTFESRRYWCDRFAAEGYETVSPELAPHLPHSDAQIEQLAHDLTERFAPTACGVGLGVFAVDACAGLAMAIARTGRIGAAVTFASSEALPWRECKPFPCPLAVHVSVSPRTDSDRLRAAGDAVGIQIFETEARLGFASPLSPYFNSLAASVTCSRTLSVLRPTLGPKLDLGRLFREHLAQEFRFQDADATMQTMIGEPYVNHIPTLTGGYGHDMLKRFYKYHFIPSAARSGNRQVTLVSEVVGPDAVVLEMVISFVHDEEHEYMLPGIAPTGRELKIPSVVVAKFQGDKLCHEHIYWDQASLLAQAGVLDATGLPIAGPEQAEKVLDPSLPSNLMMPAWANSEGKPI